MTCNFILLRWLAHQADAALFRRWLEQCERLRALGWDGDA